MTDIKEQVAIAERLQMKLLERYEALLTDSAMSASDASNLQRLLLQNGWTLDESRLPKQLKDLLTAPQEDLEEDIPDGPRLLKEA